MILVKLPLGRSHNTLKGQSRWAVSVTLRRQKELDLLQDGVSVHLDARSPLPIARLKLGESFGREVKRARRARVLPLQTEEIVVCACLHVCQCRYGVERGGDEVCDISILQETVKLISRHAEGIPAEES